MPINDDRMTTNDVKILYEDEWIKVLDKQAGVISESLGRVAHRLDKDTSGVMVLAKTDGAYEALKKQFEERKVKKIYVALVHGNRNDEVGIVTEPIMRNPKIGNKFVVGEGGKSAITEWRVLKRYEDFCLLEVRPMTGRTHQIRVHLRHLGHPTVSDPIYGNRKTWKEDLKWCPRLFLHAKYLEFTHPGTGERISFVAELPKELVEVLEKLVH